MAIFATQAKRVTDEMFIEAGQAVADQVAPALLKQGLLYPLQANILETEIQTAARVAKLVFDSGLARVERPRARPYRGENPEPGKDVHGELDPWPGIREQPRPGRDMLPGSELTAETTLWVKDRLLFHPLYRRQLLEPFLR